MKKPASIIIFYCGINYYKRGKVPMQAFGRNQISVRVSVFSPAAGLKSGQFNQKTNSGLAESDMRFQDLGFADT